MTINQILNNKRILIVDDNSMIHRDFSKILAPTADTSMDELKKLESDLFGNDQGFGDRIKIEYDLTFAQQGQEALAKVIEAREKNLPYAMAFVDVRMPPGWDGIQTIEEIWKVDPDLLMVICTAFSDHSWDDILSRFGNSHKFMILKKPFDSIEVIQLASALTQKWLLNKQANIALKELEHLVQERTRELAVQSTNLKAILENSPDYIVKIDKNLIVNYINRTHSPAENSSPLGKNILDFYPENERAKFASIFRESLATKQASNFETSVIFPDKSTHWFSNRLAPIAEQDDEISFLMVSTEITEKRSLEEQFRQSQKMEAVGRLAGGIAHDFNNLLTIHLAYADLALGDKELTSESREAVTQMKLASERAAALTAQLLSFSRQQAIRPECISLNQSINNFRPMLDRIIGEDIQLIIKENPTLDTSFIDKNQFEQALLNLVVNARDAMPSGGKIIIETDNVKASNSQQLELSTKSPASQDDLGQDYVMMAVTDTGTGMSPEVKQRIFEPFFSTKELGKGTGLGLSTVFGVVKQNQGHVFVHSEIGIGTTFKLYFPKYTDIPQKSTIEKPDTKTLRSTNKESILLVEDEDDLRLIVQSMLKKAGYKVIPASQGDEALELFKTHSDEVDIIISDVIMPKMSGKIMADKIRELRPEIPVLFMSGYTQQSINQNGVIDEGFDFIQKPFMPQALLKKIIDVLDGNQELAVQ